MSPTEADRVKLRDELQRFWSLVERHLFVAKEADLTQGRPSMAVVAVALHHAYQAFESLLERLETALDLPARTGGAWHEALLEAAAQAVSGRRPAIIPSEALPEWHSVRKFRHFFRHGSVAVEFDAAELALVVGHLERAVSATAPSVRALLAALG